MKSIMRTITVIVLVSGAVGHVGAQRQTAVPQPTQSIDAHPVSVVKHSDLVENHPLNVQQAIVEADQAFIEAVDFKSSLTSAAKVLVIPSAGTKEEDLPAIIEDMNVMSRIFDKRHKHRPDSLKLTDSLQLIARLRRSYKYSSSADSSPEGIYLAGYGCLFFMNVDFPLIAPPEGKTEKPEEGVDQVWEQTKRQMHGVRSGRNVQFPSVERDRQQYDAERVQDLKKNLIKDLKHASNIRHLQPEEQVVLSVVGSVATPAVLYNTPRTKRYRGSNYEETVDLMVDRPQPSRAVMTIRAMKSDIDAFAAGKLDFDKFSKKVEVVVLSSPAGSPVNDGRNTPPSYGR